MSKISMIKITTLMLPVIGMLALISVHTHNRDSGSVWRIPVTGYDPRDLLRGHYLTYQYDWNWAEEQKSCEQENCALCLSPENGNVNPKAALMSKQEARTSCDTYILGYSRGERNFRVGTKRSNGLTRYFIPEERARLLDKALRNNEDGIDFDMSLRINKMGQAFIEQMYVNGIPLEEWVKENGDD